MATLYAAIANGGKLWLPQIVERIESPDGQVLEEFAPRVRRELAVSPETLAHRAPGRWSAWSTSPKGTAFKARARRTSRSRARPARRRCRARKTDGRLRGRTTTTPGSPASRPPGSPKIAFAVLVEHGGHGGDVAAPLAMEIVDNYFATIAPADREAPRVGLLRRRAPRPPERGPPLGRRRPRQPGRGPRRAGGAAVPAPAGPPDPGEAQP